MKISRSSVLVGTFLVSSAWTGIAAIAHAEDKAEIQKDHVDDHAKKEKEQVDQQAKKEKEHIDERAQAKKDDIDRKNAVAATSKPTTGDEVTDTWITTKVKASLFGDKALKGSDIHVDTDQKGVVVLSGYVPTDSARVHAVSVARDTKGVKKVDDKLQLKASP